MSKVAAQDDNQNKQFKPKTYQVNEEGKQKISMIKIMMIRKIIKIDIGLMVEIGEHHVEVEDSMDKIIEEDCITLTITEMTLDKTIFEKHKITENKLTEVDTEGIIEMIFVEEVGVGLGIDNTQIISEGMIKAVVGLDHVQELAPIEIELNAISVGNMIILLLTVQLCK